MVTISPPQVYPVLIELDQGHHCHKSDMHICSVFLVCLLEWIGEGTLVSQHDDCDFFLPNHMILPCADWVTDQQFCSFSHLGYKQGGGGFFGGGSPKEPPPPQILPPAT